LCRPRHAKISSAWSAGIALVADQGSVGPKAQVEAKEGGVGLQPLLRRPAEALDNQAAIVGVSIGLLEAQGLADRRLADGARNRHLAIILRFARPSIWSRGGPAAAHRTRAARRS